MGDSGSAIVVIGSPSTLLDGVIDLLELAGHQVALCACGAEAESALGGAKPQLAILDLSDWLDSLDLPQQIIEMCPPPGVPVLLLSFSGDERIWLLEQVVREGNTRRVEIYAHSLLGPDSLLQKVKGCLAQPEIPVPLLFAPMT